MAGAPQPQMSQMSQMSQSTRGLGFWLRPTWWVRALAFWWLPALLGLFIAIVGAMRLARGGVAMSWRGMEKH